MIDFRNPIAPNEQAILDLVYERIRQIEREGFTDKVDDQYTEGELARAAAAYAFNSAQEQVRPGSGSYLWPQGWSGLWFNTSDSKRRKLVKAGALILAEIERIDRIAIRRYEAATGKVFQNDGGVFLRRHNGEIVKRLVDKFPPKPVQPEGFGMAGGQPVVGAAPGPKYEAPKSLVPDKRVFRPSFSADPLDPLLREWLDARFPSTRGKTIERVEINIYAGGSS